MKIGIASDHRGYDLKQKNNKRYERYRICRFWNRFR